MQAFWEALGNPAPVSIYTNPQKPPPISEAYRPVAWAEGAYYLPERPLFTLDPYFHTGAYYVQEAASMLIATTVPPDVRCALDMCAAPGGKSTLLATLLPPDALLVANEPVPARTSVLVDNLNKRGLTNAVVTQAYPEAFEEWDGFFDYVLADAPCSGEGLWRKQPEAVAQWSPENVAFCAARQRAILSVAQKLVRPGGTLVYSTCTYAPEENEQNIQWFLEKFGAEWDENPPMIETNWAVERLRYGFACLSHKVEGEGFYFVRLRKKESDWEREEILPAKIDKIPAKTIEKIASFASLSDEQYLYPIPYQNEILFFAVPKSDLGVIERMRKHLTVRKAGVRLGSLDGAVFTPDHALALSPLVSDVIPRFEADLPQALVYLKGAPLTDSARIRGASGYYLVTYGGYALGWAKGAGNRLNNLYPHALRIKRDIPAQRT